MDSQDKSTAEVREGNPPNPAKSEDTKVMTEPATKLVEGEHKPSDRSEGKKKSTKVHISGKHSRTGHKKHKKHSRGRDCEADSSSTDSVTSSESESDSESTGSESDSEYESKNKRKAKSRSNARKAMRSKGRKHKNHNKKQAVISDPEIESESSSDGRESDRDRKARGRGEDLNYQLLVLQMQQQIQQLQQAALHRDDLPPPPRLGAGGRSSIGDILAAQRLAPVPTRRSGHSTMRRGHPLDDIVASDSDLDFDGTQKPYKTEKRRHKAIKLDFKRVDQVWDNNIHNYKLQDTAEGPIDAQYDEFLFHVRRTFDWEGKYKATLVDIKSKHLRECLQDVMGNIKGLSLVEETPKLDPNMLFLYLEDLRTYLKGLKKEEPSGDTRRERKKQREHIESKRRHLKVLLKYIDKDYADVKKSLYPMLENGLITFDLLWALWKPNTLAYTTTYGSHDEARVFKVEMAEKHYSIMKGDFYYIDGKYFEYDGKQFGYGSMSEELHDFRGARKISSLACYPLKYHRNETELRKNLIDRGKKFVALSGVHYKNHQGLAYYKKKKTVVKVNINGRIMVDPQIHRRINPNYPVSMVRPKDHDMLSDDEGSADESGGCVCDSDAGSDGSAGKVTYATKAVKDDKGNIRLLRVPKPDDDEEEPNKERLDQVPGKDKDMQEGKSDESDGDLAAAGRKTPPEFSDEEYLIASPVVLGFAFAEKLWLEFTVSGVNEIQWNKNAYQSLVLEPKTKDIVKALVESHKYHAAESIDDVIQGKGKGLVAVLHGPPGTGKTLTAEGISELLKCPLYMASAGELGTDSRFLESELQKILDICHAWGAILLLDEADVFLEKRNMHDIHRNALVSIFLRQLEYFQGILFLTTNRVETFDDAFQSRIHIALRYDSLDHKAKKTIFKIFIERVRALEKIDLMPFTEEDFNVLARHELNGRQIKNTVRTAQALAVNKGEPLCMSHIRQVLEVQQNFDRDLKGGTGYQDAMRSYF